MAQWLLLVTMIFCSVVVVILIHIARTLQDSIRAQRRALAMHMEAMDEMEQSNKRVEGAYRALMLHNIRMARKEMGE